KKNREKEEVKKSLSEMNLKIIVNRDNSERIKTANIINENLKAGGIYMNISRKAMKIIELAQKIANKRGISVEEAWSEAVTEYKN
ncbi:hypothetical protein ACTPEM_24630, partial [Clostridioides difficile]